MFRCLCKWWKCKAVSKYTNNFNDCLSVSLHNFQCPANRKLILLSGLQQIYSLNTITMVGSAGADLSKAISDDKIFVATAKDITLPVILFANLHEAIVMIGRDVCKTLIYLLKARLFYLFSTLLMLIAAPSVEHSYESIMSQRVIGRNYGNATVALISEPDSCWFETGPYDSWIDNSIMQVTNLEVQHGNCVNGTVSLLATALAVTNAYFLLFSRNLLSLFTLFFEAPWFHFGILLELLFRLFTVFSTPRKTSSRFHLQMRLRLIIGMHRVKRISYGGLLRVNSSPAPLHSLEANFGILKSGPLSVLASTASFEDLQYFYIASDVISFHVQQLVLKHRRTAKKERRTAKALKTEGTDNETLDVVNHLLFIILLLSLYEPSEEN